MNSTEILQLVRPRRPALSAQQRRLARAINIEDMRAAAARRLPRSIFDFVDGGAEDEVALRRNRDAFAELELMPSVLKDVSAVDLSTEVLGERWPLPFGFAPSGFTRLIHHDGERAVARAAARAGIPYVAATMANVALEELAQILPAPRWFQLYIWRDSELTLELVARAHQAGYQALVVTVDVPISAVRERDLRSGITMPPTLRLRTLANAARHPNWWANLIAHEGLTFANVLSRAPAESLMAFVAQQFDPAVDWTALDAIRASWPGALVVKGVLSPEDARRAVAHGADAIYVSNHGGRQLNEAPATIDALPDVVDAVGDEAEVVIDSGFRRSGDIVKALALGAKACFVGRPYLYGLGVGGEAGVSRVIEILEDQLLRTMMLVGAASVAELDRSIVRTVTAQAAEAASAGRPR